MKEETLVTVDIEDGMTCDVIGDVHGMKQRLDTLTASRLNLFLGQFYDVLHLFTLTGVPTEKHCLLFNGDLVDRGSWSIEVILTTLAYKCTLYTDDCLRGYAHNTTPQGCIPSVCSSTVVTTRQRR